MPGAADSVTGSFLHSGAVSISGSAAGGWSSLE
jgi:hypothetical protein